MALFEVGTKLAHFGDLLGFSELASVDSGNGTHHGHMATIHLLHRIGNLSERGSRTGGFDGQLEQVALPRLRGRGDCVQRRGDLGIVTFSPDLLELCHLLFAHSGVVDFKNIERRFL